MKKHFLLSSFLLLASSAAICEEVDPARITIRHIEAKGVGYNQGYTTLEGFFVPIEWIERQNNWLPLLDLRAHVFNDGKPAANAGLGFRYLSACRTWGAIGYYDYRKTHHNHYNQVSLALESLGRVWDFRLNGYLPWGDKKSRFFGTKFDSFEGHYAFLSRKYEFALKGANAEIGAHVDRFENALLYFAAGPYYLEGEGKVAWGGEARASVDLFKYLRLEASTSYDNVFKWIGQGEISIVIPFGGKRAARQAQSRCCCPREYSLATRALQRVNRNEIIPVDKKQRRFLAIDPTTSLPYFFWFVNNTSSDGTGTFESPFSTLIAAQNASSPSDIIYVFPGDGTTTGMDQGFIFQDNQKLFGAGTSQQLSTTLGIITIPPQASGLPLVSGPANNFIVLANNNELSGIHVKMGSTLLSAIIADGITNASIHDNIIDGSAVVSGFGGTSSGLLILSSSSGQINIQNNTFLVGAPTLLGALFGIHFFSTGAPDTSYFIENNQFTSPIGTGSTAIEFGVFLLAIGSFDTILIANNQFTGIGDGGTGPGKVIGGRGFNGSGHIIIDDNSFSQTGAGFVGTTVIVRTRGTLIAEITNNTWTDTLTPANLSVDIVNQAASTVTCAVLAGNISDATGNAYLLDNSAGGTFTADVSGNIGTVATLGTITPGSCF